MAIVNMPIYRQLFDFLCLASIAISVAEASGRTYLAGWSASTLTIGPCGDARMPMASSESGPGVEFAGHGGRLRPDHMLNALQVPVAGPR